MTFQDEEALKQCFAYLFKDIFEKFVSADSREKIASVLLKEEVVKIGCELVYYLNRSY